MLAIRVGELAAIGQLSQMSQTGAFADALAASAMKTGAAVGQAVMNPVADDFGHSCRRGTLLSIRGHDRSRAPRNPRGSRFAKHQRR